MSIEAVLPLHIAMSHSAFQRYLTLPLEICGLLDAPWTGFLLMLYTSLQQQAVATTHKLCFDCWHNQQHNLSNKLGQAASHWWSPNCPHACHS